MPATLAEETAIDIKMAREPRDWTALHVYLPSLMRDQVRSNLEGAQHYRARGCTEAARACLASAKRWNRSAATVRAEHRALPLPDGLPDDFADRRFVLLVVPRPLALSAPTYRDVALITPDEPPLTLTHAKLIARGSGYEVSALGCDLVAFARPAETSLTVEDLHRLADGHDVLGPCTDV